MLPRERKYDANGYYALAETPAALLNRAQFWRYHPRSCTSPTANYMHS
jgi:hypothetical protein